MFSAFLAGDGAQIQRTVDLAQRDHGHADLFGSPGTVSMLADNDSVTVFFSRDGVDLRPGGHHIHQHDHGAPIDLSAVGTGPFTANAAIRFVANGFEAGES